MSNSRIEKDYRAIRNIHTETMVYEKEHTRILDFIDKDVNEISNAINHQLEVFDKPDGTPRNVNRVEIIKVKNLVEELLKKLA